MTLISPNRLMATAALCALAACAPTPKASWSQPDPQAETIQQIMTAKVDAAADSLWESVTTIDTAAGGEVRQPRTPADWDALGKQTQALIDGAKLLETPRPIAEPGRDLDDASTPGARTAAQVQADIARSPDSFVSNAKQLQASGRTLLTAIQARNVTALVDASAQLDAVCEACHKAFWYPHTPPAQFPSEAALAATENRP